MSRPRRTPAGDTAQVVARLPEASLAALDHCALALRITRGQAVRDAIDAWVASQTASQPRKGSRKTP